MTESCDSRLIEAIRRTFADEGYDCLFSYPAMSRRLRAADGGESCAAVAELYASGAIEAIKAATLDAYHYEEHFAEAEKRLTDTGLDQGEAHRAVRLFYEALGFPAELPLRGLTRIADHEAAGWVYVGQVKDQRPHGRGREELIIDDMVYDRREGLWIDGKLYGYLFSEEEFGAKEYGFCVAGKMIGKVTYLTPDGETFTDEFDIPRGD